MVVEGWLVNHQQVRTQVSCALDCRTVGHPGDRNAGDLPFGVSVDDAVDGLPLQVQIRDQVVEVSVDVNRSHGSLPPLLPEPDGLPG